MSELRTDCKHCNGQGSLAMYGGRDQCPDCHGAGVVEWRHPRCATCGHWAPLRNPRRGFSLVGGYCTMVDSKWANDPNHYCAEHTNLADPTQRGENA